MIDMTEAQEFSEQAAGIDRDGHSLPLGDSAENIRGQIIQLLTDGKLSAAEKRCLIAEAVVAALAARGQFFFHAERRDYDTAMFFDNMRKRLERIRSDGFTSWLSAWLKINRADALFHYVHAETETAALAATFTRGVVPEAFWAARPGAIFLSNGDGRLVRISADGISLRDNGTDGVLFAAGRTLAQWTLTEPQDPFVTCSIFRNAHCSAAHGPDLLRLWFYSLPTNPRSKPPACLSGDVGSGKTRLAKAFAELYGIPFRAAKVEEDAEANFWPCIDEGGLFTLDNADTKCRWLADALASAATDGCTQRRKLYTNCETVTYRARSWLAITSANPTFGNDSGLADRLLIVRMERRPDETSDAALTDEILAARDSGLSHIARTLQKALADTQPNSRGLNARHPDFAAFAVKIGRALGREREAITALQQAETDKATFCLENDAIASALLVYLATAGTFTGTAKELLPKIVEIDRELDGKLSAKRLGKRLATLWPHLQKTLAVARKESDRNHFSIFTLKSQQSAECAEFQTAFS